MKSKLKFLSTLSLATLPVHTFAHNKLEEVVITASKTEVPLRQVGSAMSVIDKDEINLRGPSSLMDLLRNEAGISVTNSGGAGNQSSISIRGEEGYRTLVMIDGVELSDPTGTQVMTQVQHLATTGDIERIEILRGPQGFVYGADAGGVVQIFTSEAKEGIEGGISAEYGRYVTKNLHGYIATGNETANVLLSISDKNTDSFNARVDDTSNDKDGYDNTTVHFKGVANANDHLAVKLVYRDVDAENNFDNCFAFVPEVGFGRSDNCQGEYKQSIARLSVDYAQEDHSQSLGYSLSDLDRVNFSAGGATFDVSGEIEKIDYVGAFQVTEPLKLVYGADYKTEKSANNIAGTESERNQWSVFSELQSKFNENIFFSGGFRYDDHEDFGEHVSLRISGAYIQELSGEVTIKYRASYGNGFRAPSLSELAYNDTSAFGAAADTVLSEEQSEGLDLGLDIFFSDRASLGLTVFEQTIEDEIYFDLIDFSGYLQRSGENSSTGVELEYTYQLSDMLALLGNASYNDTETAAGEQRARKPEKIWNFGVQGTFMGERLNILANYRRVQDLYNDIFSVGRVALDDYELVDISATYDVNDLLEIFARVENALDEEYQQVTGFNTARAASYVGVRFQF